MGRRIAVVLAGVVVVLPVATSMPAHAGGTVVEHAHYTDYIAPDDFFVDLCGIVTNTTVIETDTLQTFADGSQIFHTERTFIPDDPRLPIEKGAGSSFWTSFDAPEPTKIVGKPIQLFEPGGGVRALDAGIVMIGDPNVSHGHSDVGIDLTDEQLAAFYCPQS